MRISTLILRVALVAVLCGTLATSLAPPALAGRASEQSALGDVNRDRSSHSVRPVDMQARISQLARRHSSRMAAQRRLFHDCLECIRRHYGWQVAGENVGYAGSVEEANTLFMHSREHRDNILCTCFTYVGIGVVRSGGRTWITEIFFRP